MRADRLMTIVLLLQTRGKMTTQALADELVVSRRTILRDVEALSMAGIPLYAEGGHGGGIALDEQYRTTLTGLGEAEIRSLFVANNTALLEDVGLGKAAASTLLKLSAALPSRYQPSVEHIRQRIYIDPVWWWNDTQALPFWAELQQSVYEDRYISVLYEHYNGDVVERKLAPYSLVNKGSLWYVMAEREGELRTYRASRFHQVTLLDEHFQRDPAFDLPTYWHEHLEEFREAFMERTCTLKIRPHRIQFVKWLMPGRYQILYEDDQWITAELQMESMDLARMLVFGLGTDAVVVEPQELRDAVLNTARALLDQPGG